MSFDLALAAGSISTVVFAGSTLPMIVKAVRTKDLTSYSLSSLLLSNLGNLVHSVYVYSLPIGPIWALHAFYVVTTALMLALFLLHCSRGSDVRRPPHAAARNTHDSPDEAPTRPFVRSERAGHRGLARTGD